jgi:hypothetical protein
MFSTLNVTNFVGYCLMGAVLLPLTAFVVTVAQNLF